MKKIVCLAILSLPLSFARVEPIVGLEKPGVKIKSVAHERKSSLTGTAFRVQQNLTGEISSIDSSGGKIVITTEVKTAVTVIFNDKTAFRKVSPGQTSAMNAEQIKITDLQIGDRILIPGGIGKEKTPVSQIIVMARSEINAQREEDSEKRRARTVSGRISGINSQKKEISVRSRGRSGGESENLIVAAGNAKLLRYAPDSLKLTEAVAGSFTDLRVGDQVRIVGDRIAKRRRVAAEEIVSGSLMRAVGTIAEINEARSELTVKNIQTGQTVSIVVGKNTALRRITPEMTENLRQRIKERQEPRNARVSSNPERQNAAQNNRRQFENLPSINIGNLKKGDAVLILATVGRAADSQATAISIISGDGELQEILRRMQTDENADLELTTGLPGNVSGGNAGSADEEP